MTMAFFPAEVQRYIDDLTAVGLEPKIKYDLPHKITLYVQTDRVYADAVFKQQGRRWHNAKPKLTIDGQRYATANTMAELKAIIDDPDMHLMAQRLRDQFPNGFTYEMNPPEPEQHFDAADPAVPDKVSSYMARMAKVLAAYPTITVRFENPHVDLWQMRLSNLDPVNPSNFVVMFAPHHQSWKVRKVMLVVTPGEDNMGLDLGDSLESALGAYMGSPDIATNVGPVLRAKAQPRTKNDALVVKSNTVIRT